MFLESVRFSCCIYLDRLHLGLKRPQIWWNLTNHQGKSTDIVHPSAFISSEGNKSPRRSKLPKTSHTSHKHCSTGLFKTEGFLIVSSYMQLQEGTPQPSGKIIVSFDFCKPLDAAMSHCPKAEGRKLVASVGPQCRYRQWLPEGCEAERSKWQYCLWPTLDRKQKHASCYLKCSGRRRQTGPCRNQK